MNNYTKILGSRKRKAVAATVVVAGGLWLIGEVASYLPPEIAISVAAIAALIWLALLDCRNGAPRGIDNGIQRRFRGDFARRFPKPSSLWQRKDRAAA